MKIVIKKINEVEEASLIFTSLKEVYKYVREQAGILKASLLKKRLLKKERLITVKYCDEYSSIGGFGPGIMVEKEMVIEII